MATADEIGAGFSNYRGDAGLAGGSFGVIDVDTRPLQNLAAYTMLYNKEVWKQKQQETDAKITQLADLSNIALNDLRGKDKDQATKEFAELQKYASEYARKIPKTPQERMQNELEWQTKYGAFKNNFNSGKDRAVTYQKRYNDILKGTQNATAKEKQIKFLNEEFDNTDIGTKISGEPAYVTTVAEVPDPIVNKMHVLSVGQGNENVDVEISYYNPTTNAGSTDAAILGINKLYPKEGTEAYNKLSEQEKKEAAIQSTVESGGKIWEDAKEPLNIALKKYVNADGIFDAVSFENDNASNTTIMKAYNAAKIYDKYNRDKHEQAKTGMFTNKGLSVKLPDNVNPDDFKVGFIDFSKGLNANQLLQSGRFAKYTGDVFTPKVTPTDNAIQNANREAENYRARLNERGANFRAKLPYEKAKVGKVDENGNPLDFGNLIYGVNTKDKINISNAAGDKFKNVEIKNGTIVNTKGDVVPYTGDLKLPASFFDNSILVEYNKYVGGTKLDPTTGAVLANSSPTQLLNERGKYHVSFENGEITGIYAANENGTEKGSLVTVDQFQHITLNAAQKAASKYKKADVNYGKQDNAPKVAPLTQAQKYLQSLQNK